jgi:hypothetical protein
MTDEHGLFEHACGSTPRPEHGYCVDDVARALIVVCREPQPTPTVSRLGRLYLDFVLDAVGPDGTCHNRMATGGGWSDGRSQGDWWGRAVWGLGVAAVHAETPAMRARALAGFRLAAQQRSPHPRAMAFAALGAGELLRLRVTEQAARDLLGDSVGSAGTPRRGEVDVDWPWPEARLRYANGAVPEALLVAGELLPDAALRSRGLNLLGFLLRVETRGGHLSVTPVGGRGRHDPSPGYDQQPIEVAAIADACATAYRITRDPRWLVGVGLAWRWFLGDNDAAVPMFDAASGAGYDGMQERGHNLNQGAESTVAVLSTAQHARRVQAMR